MSKTRSPVNEEEEEFAEEIDDDDIVDGVNDLLTLPVEKIKDELKKRGFHPKFVDKANQKLCVSMLRKDCRRFSTRMYEYGINRRYADTHSLTSTNIFSAEKEDDGEKQKREEEEKEQKKKEEEKVTQFDPSIFMKDTFAEDGDDSRSTPSFQVSNTSISRPLWQAQNRYSDMLIENYVPESVLNSLPNNIQKQVCDEVENLTNYVHFHGNYLNRNQITSYMTIPEIIRRIIVPNIGGKNSSQNQEDNESTESSSDSSSSDDDSDDQQSSSSSSQSSNSDSSSSSQNETDSD